MFNLWVQIEVLWLRLLQVPSGNNISQKEVLPNTINPSVLWIDSWLKRWEHGFKVFKTGFECYSTLENMLSVSGKVQHTLTIWTISPIPRHLPLINEYLRSQKNLYMNVYSLAFFAITKIKLEITHMSFSGWMVKQTVLHPSHIIPLSNLKKWAVIHIETWMFLKGIGSERNRSQKVTYCTIPFMTISKKNKMIVMEKRSEVARDWGRVWL